MCQAYEAERASIIAGEQYASIAGFTAARNRNPRSSNPYHQRYEKYNHDAWKHGWGCWHERILPWALEREYRQERGLGEGIAMAQKASARFERTGQLPVELEKFLHS